MYAIIAGGGKVGANVARTLLNAKHEVTLIEQRSDRFRRLEEEFDFHVHHGDATELHVLEAAGIKRPADLVLAVTGDDEDNLVICQLAKEKYRVPKLIARVNDPRNQAHFEMLDIGPTICATSSIMSLVEHEMPEQSHWIHLLELKKENLLINEIQIDPKAPSVGKRIEELHLPDGARLISVMHGDAAEIAVGSTTLHAGDRVLAILQPDKEDELNRVLLEK
jgi:trk system potassium uptake protein TrkA